MDTVDGFDQLEDRFTRSVMLAIHDAKEAYRCDPEALWAADFVLDAVRALNRLHGIVTDDED